MMSFKEQKIADTALLEYEAENLEDLYAQIAERTGFAINDVEDVIHALTVDKTLTERSEPLLSGNAECRRTWFVKGDFWGTPRDSIIS